MKIQTKIKMKTKTKVKMEIKIKVFHIMIDDKQTSSVTQLLFVSSSQRNSHPPSFFCFISLHEDNHDIISTHSKRSVTCTYCTLYFNKKILIMKTIIKHRKYLSWQDSSLILISSIEAACSFSAFLSLGMFPESLRAFSLFCSASSLYI